jgi:hypothetical protein
VLPFLNNGSVKVRICNLHDSPRHALRQRCGWHIKPRVLMTRHCRSNSTGYAWLVVVFGGSDYGYKIGEDLGDQVTFYLRI